MCTCTRVNKHCVWPGQVSLNFWNTTSSKTIPFYRPTASLSGSVVFTFIAQSSWQTKVTDLGLVSGCQQNIPSSQVTVNKPLFFQVLHACKYFKCNPQETSTQNKIGCLFSPARPISTSPMLWPMLCQQCVIQCMSGEFNSWWQETDKLSQWS